VPIGVLLMTKPTTIKEGIEKIVTFHSDGGTSGYLISKEKRDELEELFQSRLRESEKEVIEKLRKRAVELSKEFNEEDILKHFLAVVYLITPSEITITKHDKEVGKKSLHSPKKIDTELKGLGGKE